MEMEQWGDVSQEIGNVDPVDNVRSHGCRLDTRNKAYSGRRGRQPYYNNGHGRHNQNQHYARHRHNHYNVGRGNNNNDGGGRGRHRNQHQKHSQYQRRPRQHTSRDQAHQMAVALKQGTYECAVCQSLIGRKGRVWKCGHCFTVFHMACINKDAEAEDRVRKPNRAICSLRCPTCNFVDENFKFDHTACGKPLRCGQHACESKCHEGDCEPCAEQSEQECFCGKHTKLQRCGTGEAVTELEENHSCAEVCGKLLSCAKHHCTRICHSGACSDCPRRIETRTRCACGKCAFADVERVSCLDALPVCGKKCGRLLSCGIHCCKKACHDSPCAPCSVQLQKKCRCGASTKRFKCHEHHKRLPTLCKKKCKRLKSCGKLKHKCAEICCPGRSAKSFFRGHACQEPCNRLLPCGRHRCSSLCHHGACKPCRVTYRDGLECPCGSVRVAGPLQCGAVHIAACSSTCNKQLDCGHRCCAKCHSDACPPCLRLCSRPCTTHGVLVPRMRCNVRDRSCGKPCGKLKTFDCGMHLCSRMCHSGPCAKKGDRCREMCSLPLKCGHQCMARCHAHVGRCSAAACKVQIAVKCKCGESSEKQYCRGRAQKQLEAVACTEHCQDTKRNIRLRAALSLQDAGNQQLLVSGYLGRRCRAKTVPQDIVKLICALHPNPVVYGYGYNTHFGLGIGFVRKLAKFTRLEAMSSLLEFDSDVRSLDLAFLIMDRLSNSIECAGLNEHGLCLVADRSAYEVATFVRHSVCIDLESALISEGTDQVMLKDAQHALYGFGQNHCGQLGDGKCAFEHECTFRKLKKLNRALPLSLRRQVVSITTAYGHSLMLLSDGRVYGFGSLPGRTGAGDEAGLGAPVHLDTLCDIKSIACGNCHNVFVDARNRVFANGDNSNGQLCLGYTSFPVVTPTRVEALEYDSGHKLEVHCGFFHTMIIDVTAMDAVTFGRNHDGQVGKSRANLINEPVSTPYLIAKESNFKVAHGAAGAYKTLIVTQSNELYWCGFCEDSKYHINADGRVLTPTLLSKQEIGIADTDRITRVVAGVGAVLVIVNQE